MFSRRSQKRCVDMARIFAGAIAVVCWFGLVLQFVLLLTSEVNQALSVAERIIRFFSFFTVLTKQ